MTRSYLKALAAFVYLISAAGAAQAATYANITDVATQQLSNGVQITVRSDGVLDWMPEGNISRWDFGERRMERFTIRFPRARYSGRSFIDVSMFPVSYVQMSIPQDAREGIGVLMTVMLFQPSTFTVNQSPDQQSVIVTVNSERTLETTRRRGGPGVNGNAGSRLEVEYKDGLLTVNATKVNLHVVMAEIAKKTGVEIAVDDRDLVFTDDERKAGGKLVSCYLEKMAVEDVIRSIATGYGLALSKTRGVYMLAQGLPQDLATYHLSGTRSYPMKYLRAQVASGLLPTFLFQYLHTNSEQNAVVATAPNQMLDKIGTDLEKVDIPSPQIMIEALAVEFTDTSDLNQALGINFTSPTGSARLDTSTGDLSYRTVGTLPRDFEARLQALVQKGRARIRSRPRMAALNGQRAELFIGSQKFILVKFTQFGGVTERIQGVDVGVKLRVTPWTGGTGEVTTRIEPEVSNISEVDPVTGLPVLSTRRAQTTVRVKDGETVVIGGLVLKQQFNTRKKVPILGDIPFLGYAFRSNSKSTTDSELAIFITPHILTDRGRLNDEKEEERIRQQMNQQKAD
ncbi:MAG: type II secretion system protein GspD [Armatimonadota bacterium]